MISKLIGGIYNLFPKKFTDKIIESQRRSMYNKVRKSKKVKDLIEFNIFKGGVLHVL